MEKIYCITCGEYRKFEKPKMYYIFEKILVLLIICSKFKNENEKKKNKEELIEILKIIGLIENI